MQTQTLIAYLIAPHSQNLSLYDILENYCWAHNLTMDQDPEGTQYETEHDNLLHRLLHLSTQGI